jgi:two-component system OmpR family response regulator
MIPTPCAAIYERHAMKILLAEDDVEVAKFVIAGFEEHCNSVDHVTDGRDTLSYCMEGLSALKAMRAAGKNTPVLMLTALGAVDDKVEGFQAGADDYLAKPFHFSELLARVLTRRRTEHAEQTSLNVHGLTLDLLSRTATRQRRHFELQAKEFALLDILMRNAGRIVTRTMLLKQSVEFQFRPQHKRGRNPHQPPAQQDGQAL